MALTKITSTNIGANAVTSALIANVSSATITSGLGYTPANKAGDTFTGNIYVGYDGYPAIKFRNAAGTDKAEMYVGTSAGDLNIVVGAGAAIAIDSSGRVRTPYQSLAVVGRNAGDIAAQTVPIPYNQTVTNIGSCWNGSTYRFTAQVAGYYYMSINALANNSTGVEVAIRINGGSTVVNTRGYGNGTSCSAAGIIYMAVGDYVDAKCEGSYAMNGGNGYAYSGMTIYLMG